MADATITFRLGNDEAVDHLKDTIEILADIHDHTDTDVSGAVESLHAAVDALEQDPIRSSEYDPDDPSTWGIGSVQAGSVVQSMVNDREADYVSTGRYLARRREGSPSEVVVYEAFDVVDLEEYDD